jgi:uncharacterized protein (TIGR00369 family)
VAPRTYSVVTDSRTGGRGIPAKTPGVASPAMSDHEQRLLALYRRATLGRHLGMELGFDGEHAAVRLPYGPHLDHALGEIHGGVFATLIDTAAWFTAALHYRSWIATIEFHTRLLEAVEGEDLTATGTLIRAGKRLATATAEVHTASGVLAAAGSGSFTVTGLPLD